MLNERRRWPFAAEIALSVVAGAAAFALSAMICTAARGHVPPVVLGLALLAGVLALARAAGILYALPVGVAAIQAYDWFFLPPLRDFDDSALTLIALFIVMAVIVGAVATAAGRRAVESERARGDLLREQVALRRVATLVAGGAQPDAVFAAIADELAGLIGADASFMTRLNDAPGSDPPGSGAPGSGAPGSDAPGSDAPSRGAPGSASPGSDAPSSGDPGSASPGSEPVGGGSQGASVTVVGSFGVREMSIGTTMALEKSMVMWRVATTGEPVQTRGDELRDGPFGKIIEELGIRMVVAAPVMVGARRWGVVVAGTRQESFPADTESRIGDFIHLAALAIANAQAVEQLRRLAEEQASLRRLALLVAQGVAPELIFSAVTKEVMRHFGSGTARMIRYELDGTATLLANEGTTGPHVRVGGQWEAYPTTGITATIQRTGQPARVHDYRELPGGEKYAREGLVWAVGMPIHANGRLWGMIAVGSGEGRIPDDLEARMADFTELVAIAVANAQSRAELISSRARIVAAADDARRRIERDLHDGAQQRLVALALRLRSASIRVEQGDDVHEEITAVAADILVVIDELRELSRGIHPAVLSDSGLRPALRALGRRSPVPVEIDVRIEGRLPEPVEIGAYYVVSEVLTNAVKHGNASVVEVDAEAADGVLRLRIRDDGRGGADPSRGSGLLGLKDRIEALGGTFELDSPAGAGTTITCRVPLDEEPDR
ncbi:sensor histidine kinase [Paractinoplanes globisporus]|uniref:histidine kinase n=1 Tax=Paractinoplanes globisporus TaxID=113565 RepID=A0ABW6W5G9_9ACTN|nr:GAF domain-containing protein [Actinoplanes globisporus]